MKDHKGDTGGKTGEREEDGGDDVQDGELGGAPVGKGAAGVEDQPKVGQVVAEALRLHLVAPLTHHLVEIVKKASKQSFSTFSAHSIHLATLITPKLQRRIPKHTVRLARLAGLQQDIEHNKRFSF